jgi:hypothetical protein
MAPTLSFVQVFRQRSSSDASLTLFLKRLTRNASVVVIARRRDQRFSQAPAADEANQAAKWIWIRRHLLQIAASFPPPRNDEKRNSSYFRASLQGSISKFERRRQLRGRKANAKASSSRRNDLVWQIRNSRQAGTRHRGSKMKWLLAFVVLSAASHAQGAENLPPAECGDFLRRLGLARPDIVFVGCEKRHMGEPDADRLDATYRVLGKDLAKVEGWFIRTFHAKPLRFACCGWDTPPVSFKARDGAYYEVTFGGETIVNRRKDWVKVPYLTLSVAHDAAEP